MSSPDPTLRIQDGSVGYDARTLWSGLDLDVAAGEFLAVLGPNGVGKTTLLRVALGLHPLRTGLITVGGRPPHRGSSQIGYVPQHRATAPLAPVRVRELVRFGLDGGRWGPGRPSRAARHQVGQALAAVDADALADRPVAALSGGELQRVRVAQALATDPALLLCDEPLASLDAPRREALSALIDRRRHTHGTAVVFVTHDINPILPYVDRVLYLAAGGYRLGPAADVLASGSLSTLHETDVTVDWSAGRIFITGVPDGPRDLQAVR
ncbi:ATP-binding cassette domain-containing protein [Frankia sp. KB5]|uniref:metal ABC transporter ATP-binding protein n=1 Tax=Frankia sp. KB5 TaxID=683318 RepID=UPI000A115A82|nr:ATP-binding cassette domain-containing protein [Frankia sp. KB5]ORT47790.1 ABC transporter ATP-binding protein [Frankia sp. KB5]